MKSKQILIIGNFCKSNNNPTNGVEKYIHKLCQIFKSLNVDFNCIVLNSFCLCSSERERERVINV